MLSPATVVLSLGNGQRDTSLSIWNISLGGVFVELPNELPNFGEPITLDFTFSDGREHLRCEGVVIWSSRTAPEKTGGRNGVSIRLMQLSIKEMRHLSACIGKELQP